MPGAHAFDARSAPALAVCIESMHGRWLAAAVAPDHRRAMTIPSPAPVTTDWNRLYDAFVADLRTRGTGSTAPRIGDRIDPFVLPNSLGRHVALDDLLHAGPIVLSFMRGGWCPYCRSELSAWAAAAPRLAAVGGRFIAISGEIGGRAETTRCELAPEAEMLCDVDHGLAVALGLSFVVGAEVQTSYRARGLSLADIYGDSGRILPVPATFVLDAGGIVRYAFVDPDFRVRADPGVVVAVVEALG